MTEDIDSKCVAFTNESCQSNDTAPLMTRLVSTFLNGSRPSPWENQRTLVFAYIDEEDGAPSTQSIGLYLHHAMIALVWVLSRRNRVQNPADRPRLQVLSDDGGATGCCRYGHRTALCVQTPST